MTASPFEPALQRIVLELRPYLDEVVIIGGWVPYLYQRYGELPWQGNPSLTAEVDVLVERTIRPAGRVPIPDLLRHADFRPSRGEGGLAVWERSLAAGEKIEFLVENGGTRAGEGAVVAVTEQAGMAAISLTGLELMRWFRRTLSIPVPDRDDQGGRVEIWLPLLGAYAVNKAGTFSRRRELPGQGNPKQAKDLLYLRDLMAAGPAAVRMIQDDILEMTTDSVHGRGARAGVRDAANTLGLALRGALRRILPQVAAMLAEREPSFTQTAALADVEGHLTDLVEILEERAQESR